jgi:hypothetical protein
VYNDMKVYNIDGTAWLDYYINGPPIVTTAITGRDGQHQVVTEVRRLDNSANYRRFDLIFVDQGGARFQTAGRVSTGIPVSDISNVAIYYELRPPYNVQGYCRNTGTFIPKPPQSGTVFPLPLSGTVLGGTRPLVFPLETTGVVPLEDAPTEERPIRLSRYLYNFRFRASS